MGIRYALVAQWIEHWIADPEVDGSTPFGCTEYNVENGEALRHPIRVQEEGWPSGPWRRFRKPFSLTGGAGSTPVPSAA